MEMVERDPVAEVAQIFTSAGWTPNPTDGWDGFVFRQGTVIGGIDPWGKKRTTGIVAVPNEGPNNIVDAALWLVEHARQQANPLTTEATLEPLALQSEEGENLEHEASITDEPSAVVGDASNAEPQVAESAEGLDGGATPEGGTEFSGDRSGSWEEAAGSEETAPIDADFTIEDLGSEDLLTDDDFELPAIEGADLPEEEAPELAALEPPQDRFYGLDDLDRRRSLRIGDVVRLSRALQANVKAEMGDHDFAAIQGAVLRDTVDGVYRGDQATYDLFVQLSTHQSHITRIQHAEAEKVAFLEAATRPEVEAFVAEENWP